jgi:hypothetical protein
MNLKNIYIGSWFPKTVLHLEELFNFLDKEIIADGLSKNTANKLYKKLNLSDIKLQMNNTDFQYLKAQSGSFEFSYFEDGLLIIKKEIINLKDDISKILNFYHNELSPCLAFLYSRGAKGLEIIRSPGSEKMLFITSEETNNKEINIFFNSLNKKINSVNNYKEFSIYYTNNIILLNFNKSSQINNYEHFVEYLILNNEIKQHLNKLLQIHRYIWDKADEILAESEVKIKKLPHNNEMLNNFANIVANIKSRINQIKLNFDYREIKLQKNIIPPKLLLEFKNLDQVIDYLKNLFEMTHQHLQNNISRLSTLYQENQQNALNKLQLLFLISVVTGFLTLGAFPGAKLFFYDVNNNLISEGEITSFDIPTLLQFGAITLLTTFIIYYLWNFIFKNIKAKIK